MNYFLRKKLGTTQGVWIVILIIVIPVATTSVDYP